MFIHSIYILLFSLTITYSYPCPQECICKPIDTDDLDFTWMSYIITCTNLELKNDQLVFAASGWSINEDKPYDLDDDDQAKTYEISIDISNSLSLKKFTKETIKFTNFSYVIKSLSLTDQGNTFTLDLNSFASPIYENLKVLNLSSCCKQIPKQCQAIFRPLTYLHVLDLSGSDMYKTCLNTPDTISSKLHDLILRNNVYDTNIFSTSSKTFNGVRRITGTLDLQNSRFKVDTKSNRNCLFNSFKLITKLDLSLVQFESESNDIDSHLAQLLMCDLGHQNSSDGRQLLDLYLRNLNLAKLPEWLTYDRFPLLKRLDLSNNNIYAIDIKNFQHLNYLALAYNPIELFNITWSANKVYQSINLRSTIRNQTYNLSKRLKNLLKLTKNVDFSENEGDLPVNITNIPVTTDFNTLEFSLYISRTNLYSFNIDVHDLRRLDVSFNYLTELNLEKQIKLNYLDCSHQNLRKLILSQELSELEEIKCSNNSLKTIENFSLINHNCLKLIDLSSNYIASLAELFQNLTSHTLRTINLKSNSIEIIPSYLFHNKLTSLYEINLSYNRIHTIKRYAFQSPNLRILDLTGNLLKIVEPQAIYTMSLRLFYVNEDIQQLKTALTNSESLNKFSLLYRKWFEKHGQFMKRNSLSSTHLNSIEGKTKSFRKHSELYITLGAIFLCVLFGGVYFYRKYHFKFVSHLKRYRELDKSDLIQRETELEDRLREDNDTVIDLNQPPYKSFSTVTNN